MFEVFRAMEEVRKLFDELQELRRTAGDGATAKRLGEICLEKTGLPFEFVKRSAPEQVLALLDEGGIMQPIRAVTVAELLLQDAEINTGGGKVREALIERAQAYALISAVLDKLSLEDQRTYQAKLAALAATAVNSEAPAR